VESIIVVVGDKGEGKKKKLMEKKGKIKFLSILIPS
jgi:hypothetical protein